MQPEQLATLLTQHTAMLAEIERLWIAFLMLLFLGLLFLLVNAITAVWTARTIARRQNATEEKWRELVEILLHNARQHKEDTNAGH